MSLVTLSPEQLSFLKENMGEYLMSANAATGSKLDPNANVTQKTISTAENEIFKPIAIQVNRSLLTEIISGTFGVPTANQYLQDIQEHMIYVHDETSLKPYCTSITMYPFLLNGMTEMGGESGAPRHLLSFCGSFINLVLATSNQFAGAVATVEFLTYFTHFAAKELGNNFHQTMNDACTISVLENALQHVVYALNQPVTRGDQAVFWNISLFDEHYFKAMFGDFIFPDGTRPEWEQVKVMQNFFQEWFLEERKKSLLTFPVVTAAMLTADGKPKDSEFAETRAQEMSRGSSFFIYMSESADSLASCCRLRNEMSSNEFSYSLGAGGVMTGSINVITINANRAVQRSGGLRPISAIRNVVKRIHMYQVAYRKLMDRYFEAGILSAYNAGLIALDKQFLTIGINGLLEAAEYMGIDPTNNEQYRKFVNDILKGIYDENRLAEKMYGYKFNTEFVPAENLGVKNADWDRKDGFKVPRDCYNSYFYRVEDSDMSIIDKFHLYDRDMVKYLDGGSALHLNLVEHPTASQWLKLFDLAAGLGVQYWTYNVPGTRCKKCNTRDVRFLPACSKCGSEDLVYATRVIGYLKEVESFSMPRQKEASERVYHDALDLN